LKKRKVVCPPRDMPQTQGVLLHDEDSYYWNRCQWTTASLLPMSFDVMNSNSEVGGAVAHPAAGGMINKRCSQSPDTTTNKSFTDLSSWLGPQKTPTEDQKMFAEGFQEIFEQVKKEKGELVPQQQQRIVSENFDRHLGREVPSEYWPSSSAGNPMSVEVVKQEPNDRVMTSCEHEHVGTGRYASTTLTSGGGILNRSGSDEVSQMSPTSTSSSNKQIMSPAAYHTAADERQFSATPEMVAKIEK
jgi:hypothetical protein